MPTTSLPLIILLVSSLILSSFATSGDLINNLDDLRFLWSHWKDFYHKTYTPIQEPSKFLVFVDNYQKVVAYNAQSTNVKLSLNKFADLTPTEFKSFLSLEPTITQDPLPSNFPNLRTDLPKSVDWRLKGAVSPVKTQGQSTSCWLFAATDALESWYFIQSGELVDFSRQQLLDCVPGTPVCHGQDFINAFNYTAHYGIETEKDYPETAGQGTCHYDASKAIKVNSNYTLVKPKSSKALKEALTKQPVPVFIEADQFVFQFYSSGVIDSDSCGANVDHGVLVVGYDVVSGKDAFIVKNSWGVNWGVEGYVYISTKNTPNQGNGVCGILSQPVAPTL